MMTSRERVMRAIDHKEPDRLPRDLWVCEEVSERLAKLLHLDETESLKDRLGVDLEYVAVPITCPYTDGRNIWGVLHSNVGLTASVSFSPLAEATTVEQVEAHTWPDPDWADIEAFARSAAVARKTGRAVVGSSWGSVCGETYRLMGMENFLIGMVLYPDVVHRIIQHVTDFFLEVDRRCFESARGLLDLSFHGNDFGTQRGLLFSRELWVEFFSKPIQALAQQAASFGLRPMFHSCGAVSELIQDLIDVGIKVLDPVQSTAEGMEPERLKREFGTRICFHGCVSSQNVLCHGTPHEVWEHVRHICDTMKPGGGYIFSSDQQILQDTPPENVAAMYQAVEKFGNY